jgi:hypothetical protein
MNEVAELGFAKKEVKEESSLMHVSEARAVAEVQAGYIIAKKFPRNQHESYMKIIEACKRPFLAEQAMYAYPRGNQTVTGPSIRLAEAMAQAWGNIKFGIKEISQANGVSVVEAYAIDLETNTPSEKIFHVPHIRDTKKGRVKLTDARDIYELVANQGARRLRNCILAIIPGDVTEAAVDQCKKTLESGEIPVTEQIKKMILAFDELGVKVEHLEKRLGHKLEATIPQEIVNLKIIYKSIKDGYAKREDFFEINFASKDEAENTIENLLAEKAKNYKQDSTTQETIKDDKK